jgi:microsomal dipeptidase-like Zn-dependent dipeptidase
MDSIHSSLDNSPLVVDAMQYSRPERQRFIEWREGGLVCVHVTVSIWEGARETLSNLGEWNRIFDANSDLIALARSTAEIAQIAASGRTAVVLGFQDTSPFEDDIELVEIFWSLGIRIVQLTYNIQNRIASGCWEPDDQGVSKFFGRGLIAEMNRVGMLIDVSHCSHQSCLDAIEFSSRPIAITHANPAEFVGPEVELNRRNKSTALLGALAESGGVVGLSMYPKIMRGGSAASLDTFIDMVKWTVDQIGIDAVGFGSDFYTGWPEDVLKWWRAGRWARESAIPLRGFSSWPEWFRSPTAYPAIVKRLAKRGFSPDEVAKIAGGNWMRLFGDGFHSSATLASTASGA